MNKRESLLLGLIFFIAIFNVVGHVPVLSAENNDSNVSLRGNVIDSDNKNANDSDDMEANDSVNEKEDENQERDEENKIKTRTREIITRGNCTIKIERKVEIEDGKKVEVVKRKMECADGTRAEVKIKIENRTADGKFRERIKYEFKGKELEVETEEGIDLEEDTNGTEYRLRARFMGNVTDIKIMPDTASEIALERLRALNISNISLKEIHHKNIPRIVYNIETNKHGRFLGVFKLSLKFNAEVDPETGEVIGINKPWWAFLVSGEDSDQTENQVNETGNETVNETEVINETNSSV